MFSAALLSRGRYVDRVDHDTAACHPNPPTGESLVFFVVNLDVRSLDNTVPSCISCEVLYMRVEVGSCVFMV